MRRFAFLCLLALVACDKEPTVKVTVTTPVNSCLADFLSIAGSSLDRPLISPIAATAKS
jgi:hypothetical protein